MRETEAKNRIRISNPFLGFSMAHFPQTQNRGPIFGFGRHHHDLRFELAFGTMKSGRDKKKCQSDNLYDQMWHPVNPLDCSQKEQDGSSSLHVHVRTGLAPCSNCGDSLCKSTFFRLVDEPAKPLKTVGHSIQTISTGVALCSDGYGRNHVGTSLETRNPQGPAGEPQGPQGPAISILLRKNRTRRDSGSHFCYTHVCAHSSKWCAMVLFLLLRKSWCCTDFRCRSKKRKWHECIHTVAVTMRHVHACRFVVGGVFILQVFLVFPKIVPRVASKLASNKYTNIYRKINTYIVHIYIYTYIYVY